MLIHYAPEEYNRRGRCGETGHYYSETGEIRASCGETYRLLEWRPDYWPTRFVDGSQCGSIAPVTCLECLDEMRSNYPGLFEEEE